MPWHGRETLKSLENKGTRLLSLLLAVDNFTVIIKPSGRMRNKFASNVFFAFLFPHPHPHTSLLGIRFLLEFQFIQLACTWSLKSIHNPERA